MPLTRLRGTASATASGQHSVLPGHAFISYVHENSAEVDRLQERLVAEGVRVWRDTDDLLPGELWRDKIRHAIVNDAFVFLSCFSSKSAAREKSYQNEELALTVEQIRIRRPGETWLIPVRFDDCKIPDLNIGPNLSISSFQSADLFGPHEERAFDRLVAAVQRILERQAGSS